jgi:hypothetical protein
MVQIGFEAAKSASPRLYIHIPERGLKDTCFVEVSSTCACTDRLQVHNACLCLLRAQHWHEWCESKRHTDHR